MTVTNIGVQRPSTALRRSDGLSAIASLRHHWPEYLMELGELGSYLFVACVVKFTISFFLIVTVLFATNHKRLAPYTAYFVGVLIATYFTFEAPLSGMSTNPARTFGSALHAN